jgi:RNA polymerase sigma factor (sigma-70 family)
MKPRQTILARFSTFVEFEADRFHHWSSDRPLERTMQLYLKQHPQEPEEYWVLYWHESWRQQQHQAAQNHLTAYLQEICYWVASHLDHATMNQTASGYSVADYFQLTIVTLPRVLKNFNPMQTASLRTFAGLCFGNTIRDTLRQQKQADQRSDWGLLRKISQKQLVESLRMMGYSLDMIESYRLAWICFKQHCIPSDPTLARQLSQPSPQAWTVMVACYNSQRPAHRPAASEAELESWLKTCAKKVRSYLYPAIGSLNLRRDGESNELEDDLPDQADLTPMVSLLNQEELQERRSQWSQIHDVLQTALDQLDPKVQQLLILYCQEGLTQQQIAAQLEMKQYTVSRRLTSAKEALLLALARWSQEHLHKTVTSTALKDMTVMLEEWLQRYYRQTERKDEI